MDGDGQRRSKIMIVGNCASGKSTLARGLRELGYQANGFSQEHSHSAKVWMRRCPDVLILLKCEYETIKERRNISWSLDAYKQQLFTLDHARQHADMIVSTDGLKPEELIQNVHVFLQKLGIHRDRIDNA